jgi:hypothetical protein
MSYQQTSSHTDTAFPNRSTSNMYPHTQARTHGDSQSRAASYSHGPTVGAQNDNPSMNAMMTQFAGISLPGANMASTTNTMGPSQLPLAASSQYFFTADGQLLMAPSMYPTQPMAPTQLSDASYGSYPATLPYLAQAAYHGYVPGYPVLPYTPGRAGYFPDRSDHLHKEVPGLENRRGSYSTNESAPGTPYYGSVSQRDQSTQIAAVDRSPFGSTPSPQQIPLQHAIQQSEKQLPYKTIPINVDIDALLMQHPAIPRAVPAVFTPRENMRTLDQSLSNPIYGNRNVYIRGLHPNTDDETLAAYAARFGKVETSKAIIDTSTGACKGYAIANIHCYSSLMFAGLDSRSTSMSVIPSSASVDFTSLAMKWALLGYSILLSTEDVKSLTVCRSRSTLVSKLKVMTPRPTSTYLTCPRT